MILALSKSHWPRREHCESWEHSVRNECVFFPVITGLQKPRLRGIHTMTPLCQQSCELEINGLPWNLLQHHSSGRADSVKKKDFRDSRWWNLSKAEIYFQEKKKKHTTTAERAARSQLFELLCLRRGSSCDKLWSQTWPSAFTGNWRNTCRP